MARQSNSPNPITLRDILGTAAVQQETVLFVLVSSMDLCMTWILLDRGGGRFVESNPVARFFLFEWGPRGLVYFKFAMVIVVCVLAQIIARSKPRAASWLLKGAVVLIAVVVVYSLTLLLQNGNLEDIDLETGTTSIRSTAFV